MSLGENICMTNEAETGGKNPSIRVPRRQCGILNIQVELILIFYDLSFKRVRLNKP